jgi:TfoX/Sxy family transcriptional regulator of competence genes
MASKQETADRVLECLAGAGRVSAKKMFGEFCVYLGSKPVALVADDRLFVKPTRAGREFAPELSEAPAYPGAKPSLLVPAERWDDRAWLCELVTVTASELPQPKPRKKR